MTKNLTQTSMNKRIYTTALQQLIAALFDHPVATPLCGYSTAYFLPPVKPAVPAAPATVSAAGLGSSSERKK